MIGTGIKTLFKGKGKSQRSMPTGPQLQGGGLGAQCTVNGVDYCAYGPWNEDLLGPLPGVDPPLAKFTVRPAPDNAYDVLPTCGSTCDGPASTQCSGAASHSDCSCRVLPLSVAKLLGLDPVAGLDPVGMVSYCLQIAAVQSILLQQSARQTCNLSKRDLAEMKNEWPCPCNRTYVSMGCYGSHDGMIWEDSGLKMGMPFGDL